MTVLTWLMALAAAAEPEPVTEPPPATLVPAGTPATPSLPGATRLTIEEALRLALDSSETLEIAETDVTRADGDRWVARSSFFPSVEASLTYQRTFASEFDNLDFGVPTAYPGTTTGTPYTTPPETPVTPPPDTTPPGEVDEEDVAVLPFGRPDNWRAGLVVNQSVFAGGRTHALTKIAAAGRRAADVSLESTRASVALETAQAYFDAALADRLLEIQVSSLTQTGETLRQTELGQNVGRQPEFDVLRARVAVENQEVAVINARRQRDLARQRLAQLLDLPVTTPIELASPLEDSGIAEAAVEVSDAAPAGSIRAPVRQVTETATIASANVTVARASALPLVAASLSVGWVSFDPNPFAADAQPWLPTSNASVALTVPLFNGGRIWGEVMKARADVLAAEARVDQTTELAALDAQQAQAGLDAAAAQWSATEGVVEQAQRAYDIAALRFGEGVSTQLELSDSRLQLERALANRAQSARDLAVAKTRIALLASLPLQTAASSF